VKSTPGQSDQPPSAAGDTFVTTHWTVVLAAGRNACPEADRALEQLCQAYWYPLYAYVRRRGYSPADAEDLTQAFFARLLEKKFLADLDQKKGKFRAFLLAALKHFLANEWDKTQRQKRGGGQHHLSFDWQTADTKFQVADGTTPGPDRSFDREWALALLDTVIQRLKQESEADGKGKLFDQLKVFLTAGTGELSHAEAARNLGLDETAVRVAVHRLRKRYRGLLREEIAQTLADPAMVDEEMQALFGAFSS
jgi:RNA polymerase sigma factor (sigma-70 family)